MPTATEAVKKGGGREAGRGKREAEEGSGKGGERERSDRGMSVDQ